MYSQAGQDLFVKTALAGKRDGYFVEIGSNHYSFNNNSYYFEKNLNWKGIMVEYDNRFLSGYKINRPNSIHIINDATKVNYLQILNDNKFPKNMDYLQIDLDVDNRSTLTTLEMFDKTVFDEYKFATITFETDIYTGNFFDTREKSREIFKKRGYKLVYPDIDVKWLSRGKWVGGPFEDWWIHPDLVDESKLPEKFHYTCPNHDHVSNGIKNT